MEKKLSEMEKKSFWPQIKSIYQTLEDSLTDYKKEKLIFKLKPKNMLKLK
jgi:hypothetical protein